MHDLPLGFGMALAQHEDAMQVFSNLPHAKQKNLIQQASQVRSKQEMQELVESITP